jgi:hypothetical protein
MDIKYMYTVTTRMHKMIYMKFHARRKYFPMSWNAK